MLFRAMQFPSNESFAVWTHSTKKLCLEYQTLTVQQNLF